MSEPEAFAEATRRYQLDPEFHARVEHTVGLIEASQGGPLHDHDRNLAAYAAALALVVAEQVP